MRGAISLSREKAKERLLPFPFHACAGLVSSLGGHRD